VFVCFMQFKQVLNFPEFFQVKLSFLVAKTLIVACVSVKVLFFDEF
jgi:hypothetical protein